METIVITIIVVKMSSKYSRGLFKEIIIHSIHYNNPNDNANDELV